MPVVQLRKHEQILERMISLVVARSNLSDVTDTSVFKHLLAACAREIDEAYYQMTRLNDLFDLSKAAGEDLDARAQEIQPGTMRRIQARKSICTVRFSRTGTSGDVVVPMGTVVKTGDGKIFKTTIQTSILNTQTQSALVAVIADEAGASGNVAADTIVKFGSKIAGVDAVTNPSGATQGRDKESDDAFRQRLRNFIASLARCPIQALEFAAVGTEDPVSGKQVVFAHVLEDPILYGKVTLYVDDGAGTAATLGAEIVSEVVTSDLSGPPLGTAVGGEEFLTLDYHPVDIDNSPFTVFSTTRGPLTLEVEVFVNPASGRLYFSPALSAGEGIQVTYTPFDGLIPVVQKIIDGDVDDRANFPGYRAGGTLVRVLSPNVVTLLVEAALSLAPGVDRTTAIADAEDAVMDYINNLGISGDVVRNELIQRIMEVDGVVDMTLTLPADNVSILDNQIPRISSGNITIT